MTQDRVEASKLWVEEILLRLASEHNIQVGNISWKGPSDDPRHFDHKSYSIYFCISGESDSESMEFSRRQLETCAGDTDEQRNMQNRIRAKIASLKN
jgi:hypothetical protein